MSASSTPAVPAAVVVSDAAELRAELARGTRTIELAADIYLAGQEIVADNGSSVIYGNNFTISQSHGRHFEVTSTKLELRELTLAVVPFEVPAPTSVPTTATFAPTGFVVPCV